MTDLFEVEETSTTSLDLRRMQREARRRQRRLRTLMATSVAVVILALGASIGWNFVQTFKSADAGSADYEGAGQGAVVIIINPGESGAEIAKTLYDNGVVASEQAFKLATYEFAEEAKGIKPGYYLMQREMKAEYALFALLEPERRQETTIQIPEGYRLEAIYEKIASVTDYTLDQVSEAAADVEALKLPAEAGGNLEGWLFPATYKFNPGVHPTDILAEMVKTTVSNLEDAGVPREKWEETLIIASLIEGEARLKEDRAMVSGVIHNRLAIGKALELDSTIKYFAPSDGVFTSAQQRAVQNPYNTYLNTGLPPGPIKAPGRASIDAALAPETHSYLYFVTVNLDTGETKYATTFSEHLKNVAILQAWMAANGDDS